MTDERLILDSMSQESMMLAMAIEFIKLFQHGREPRFNPGPYLGDAALGTVVGKFGRSSEDGSPG